MHAIGATLNKDKEKIIESWGLEVPKEAAGKRHVAKKHIFAAVFECQLGGLGAKKIELNEERSDMDEESDDHECMGVPGWCVTGVAGGMAVLGSLWEAPVNV